jgi:hypothetical protein
MQIFYNILSLVYYFLANLSLKMAFIDRNMQEKHYYITHSYFIITRAEHVQR